MLQFSAVKKAVVPQAPGPYSGSGDLHTDVCTCLFLVEGKEKISATLLVAEWQMVAWIASMLIPFQQWKNRPAV